MLICLLLLSGSFAALFGIWFAYPIVLWGRARLTSAPLKPDLEASGRTSVSVILATRDGVDVIRRRLANVLASEYPAYLLQVIVALDALDARCTAAELADADPRVRVLLGDAPGGKAAALNAAVRSATGDVLVFIDAQQRFEPTAIRELVNALADQRFGAVSGSLELGGAGRRLSPLHWYWRMERAIRQMESDVYASIGVTGAIYAARRTLWPQIPAGTLLDDVYVPMRIVMDGHRVGFVSSARASDARDFDAAAEGARKTRTLTGVVQLLHLLPGITSPKRNPVWWEFCWHKLARLATPLAAIGALFAVLGAAVAPTARYHAVQQLLRSAIAIATLGILVVPALRRRAATVLTMQIATLSALRNGLFRRWAVWTK